MALHRLTRVPQEVVEPPRDGEFFFEDARVEKELAGLLSRAGHRMARVGDWVGAIVERHPVVWMGVAVCFGIVTTSLVFKL